MGSHAKQQNQLLDTQRNKSNSQYDTLNTKSGGRSDTAYKNSQDTRGNISGRLNNLSDTGGLTPEEIDRYRATFGTGGNGNGTGGGYGGGGGSSVASELAGTGGIDESKFADALKGYSEFAHGGGLDADAIRARSNSVIPSFYAGLKNDMSRRRMLNPYAPTYDAAEAKMARDTGQQQQQNIRNTELDIADKSAGYKEFGIKGLGDLNTNIQDMIQRGKIAGGQQQISNAGIGAQYAGLNEQAAARRQSGEESILGMIQSGRLKGIGGLQDLYGSDTKEAGDYSDRQYGGYGSQNNSNMNNINSRQDPSAWWKNLAQAGLGGASGVLSGYFGGGGVRKKSGGRTTTASLGGN